jgi:hypothetical protein
MLRILILFSFVLTASAANAACPQLDGKYECDWGMKYNLSFKTLLRSNITYYEITVDGTKTDIVADGLSHSYRTVGRNISYLASCSRGYLDITSSITEETARSSVSYRPTANADLINVSAHFEIGLNYKFNNYQCKKAR